MNRDERGQSSAQRPSKKIIWDHVTTRPSPEMKLKRHREDQQKLVNQEKIRVNQQKTYGLTKKRLKQQNLGVNQQNVGGQPVNQHKL